MDFKSFLAFDNMISATLIKWIFYIGLALTIISGFVVMRESFFIGLIIIIIGPLILRVYCEIMIVLFKIHESLIVIKNKD